MGDDSEVQAKGIGRIDLEDGYFNNVLFVPYLAAKLLSVYQITHIGESKRVTFTPDTMEIAEIYTKRWWHWGLLIIKVECTHSLIYFPILERMCS